MSKGKELFIRARTALFFVIVMLGGICWNVYSFGVLMALIMVASLHEFQKITLQERPVNRTSLICKVLTNVLALTLFGMSYLVTLGLAEPKLFLIFPGLFFLYFVIEMYAVADKPFNNIAWNVLGIVYLVLPFVVLNFMVIRPEVYHFKLVLAVLFIIWANDSCAYLVGSRIGKNKVIPRISPGKSWEGLAGGAVGAALVAVILHYWFKIEFLDLHDWIILGVIISIGATLGDLAESMLKRSLKIKDSGTLLPGHGGVLDRFDAFYFAIPFAAMYLALVGKM